MAKNEKWRDVDLVTGIISLILILLTPILVTAQNTVEPEIYSELLQQKIANNTRKLLNIIKRGMQS